jgi:hypothetical protein
MKRRSPVLVAVTLLAIASTSLYREGRPQTQAPRPRHRRNESGLSNATTFSNGCYIRRAIL